MAWDNGYRKDNPVRGIRLKGPPRNRLSWPARISSSASPRRFRPSLQRYRLGHGDLQATTRYVKVLDGEDPKAAEVMPAMLGDVA
jgi:hypothetical protein